MFIHSSLNVRVRQSRFLTLSRDHQSRQLNFVGTSIVNEPPYCQAESITALRGQSLQLMAADVPQSVAPSQTRQLRHSSHSSHLPEHQLKRSLPPPGYLVASSAEIRADQMVR